MKVRIHASLNVIGIADSASGQAEIDGGNGTGLNNIVTGTMDELGMSFKRVAGSPSGKN